MSSGRRIATTQGRPGNGAFAQLVAPPTANLLAYIDPSSSSRLTLSGSDVDAIASWAGTDVVANTGTNRPTYAATGVNGRPGILCASASTQYLTDATSAAAATASDNGAFTAYIVVSPTSVTSKQFFSLKNNSPNNYCGLGTGAGGSLRFFRGAGGATINDVGGAALANNVPHFISVIYNGTNVSAWVDGIVSINNAAAAADIDAITGLVYGSGWFGASASQPMDGHIGKFLLYSGAHSAANRSSVESYLKAHYGL